MLNHPLVNEIVDKLSKLPTFAHMEKELKQILNPIVRQALEGLDLVSREEFDVQRQVLLKTRRKVEALEKLLEEKSPSKDIHSSE